MTLGAELEKWAGGPEPHGFSSTHEIRPESATGFPAMPFMLGQYRLSGAHSGKTPSPGHGLSAPGHGTRSNANWAPGMLTRSWFRSVRATEGGGGFLLCNLHCSLLLHGYIQSATFDQVAKSAEVTFQHYKLLDVQDSSVHSTKDTTKSNEM